MNSMIVTVARAALKKYLGGRLLCLLGGLKKGLWLSSSWWVDSLGLFRFSLLRV